MAARRSTPEAAQPQIRDDYRAYLDARLAFYTNLIPDRVKALEELALSEKLQKKIWTESVAAAKTGPPAALARRRLSQRNDRHHHYAPCRAADASPGANLRDAVVACPGQLCHRGVRNRRYRQRWWLHTIVYATALTLTVYTIIDLEFPRAGIIRVDRYDQALVDLRNSMNE